MIILLTETGSFDAKNALLANGKPGAIQTQRRLAT
jgi:hypothetical protein